MNDVTDLTKIAGWILLGLSAAIMLGAALAAVFGKRYMRWGLNHLPALYGGLMERLYKGPKIFLWGAILAEFAIVVWLFFMA